jgi:hypothetical protein
VLTRLAAVPLLLVIASAAWMGYYDYRAFGSPATLPYTINRATYAMAPYYVWQKSRPEPAYRHAVMRSFYYVGEEKAVEQYTTVTGFLAESFRKFARAVLFFAGTALLLPLVMVRRVLLDRRIRFLVICALVLAAGMAIEIFLIPHYLAAFTAAFYAIGLQAMRHLRLWRPGGQPVGAAMVRYSVMICVIMCGLRLYAGPLHLALPEWPASNWNSSWYGPDHFGTERVRVEKVLNQLPGKQLAIVRYSSQHNPFDEWVYNAPDIDGSKVVWAREMNASDNLELTRYYKNRQVWLVQPDTEPAQVTAYAMPGELAAASKSTVAGQGTERSSEESSR